MSADMQLVSFVVLTFVLVNLFLMLLPRWMRH
jgi:hypothetical protein